MQHFVQQPLGFDSNSNSPCRSTQAKGALCVGVTNTVGSAISNATHCGVHLNAGFEIGVASTKVCCGGRARAAHVQAAWSLHAARCSYLCTTQLPTHPPRVSSLPALPPHASPSRPRPPQAYTSQIVALTMMALLLGADSRAKAPKRIAAMLALSVLADAVRDVLKLDSDMKALAEKLKDAQNLIFFGRGYNYSTGLEAALKVKEVALIHSEGINAGEMKHGPLALVDENLPIVVVSPGGRAGFSLPVWLHCCCAADADAVFPLLACGVKPYSSQQASQPITSNPR
jgi:fructoselysine-6-P-deglycase FrlB-like protein